MEHTLVVIFVELRFSPISFLLMFTILSEYNLLLGKASELHNKHYST